MITDVVLQIGGGVLGCVLGACLFFPDVVFRIIPDAILEWWLGPE